MTAKNWCIHNIIEQTMDCYRCGDRWDFKANCVDRSIDTVIDRIDSWGKRHDDCETSPKGKSLEIYNNWYFDESQVIFDLSLDQLYNLIKIRIPSLSRDKFEEEYHRTNYPSFEGFGFGDRVEVHKLFPRYRHFIFRQMWEPDTRENLIKAIKSVGGRIVGREETDPMPKSDYGWDAPQLVRREPERVWN